MKITKTTKTKAAGEKITQESKLTNPRQNLEGFSIRDTMEEIESAVVGAGAYYQRMQRNENTRQCMWPGKNGTGRKLNTETKSAKPWHGAADHEVRLAQEVLLQLTALSTAAVARGSMNVTPMEGTDVKAASQMKLVMRYYLETAMRGEKLIQTTRWASWARRYGHAVMYVGWKTVKALEKMPVLESELIEFRLAGLMAEAGMSEGATGSGDPVTLGAGGGESNPGPGSGDPGTLGGVPREVAMVVGEEMLRQAEEWVREYATEEELADQVLLMRPELRERRGEAKREALKCVKELRADKTSADPTGHYFAVFLKENRPVWEALRQGIDFFCPAETQHQESFDDARWLYRMRWMSIQQVREEGAVRGWDPQWVMEVTTKHTGKAQLFSLNTTKTPWVMSGLGVGRAENIEASKFMVQIGELYERRTTLDGVQCLYKTVLHPDLHKSVAKRELLEDWHGHYPFVATTNEMDEPLLLDNMGVPEIVHSAQNAIKTQHDSRDDAASLTTLPPWTGPENLQGTVIAPGTFIPEWRNGSVRAFTLPPPDGRSIEIEETLRASVDRYFGLMSKAVPDALSQLLGQVGTDWFLTSYSRVIALTAQLVQQRMTPMTGARITGTSIVFDATREGVRGAFDFSVKFDVKSLDLEWFKSLMSFAQEAMTSFDQNNLTNKRVFLEMAYNMIDPGLADRALQTDDGAMQTEMNEMKRLLTEIFSGGVPDFVMGVDYATRAQVMVQDLQQSPVRQQIMQTVPQIAAVWQNYLQKLLAQVEQQGANKQAGIQGGGDPLKQSPLAQLKAGGWQAMMGGQTEAAAMAA